MALSAPANGKTGKAFSIGGTVAGWSIRWQKAVTLLIAALPIAKVFCGEQLAGNVANLLATTSSSEDVITSVSDSVSDSGGRDVTAGLRSHYGRGRFFDRCAYGNT